ncbi:hypothetical protein [Pseudoxanthomonas sp.]|uniref:hypothetical protein n=1 Tax=Pseudoxanthomonas sp. TaxID=1871049 RepID=UPI00262A8A2C|nr:hypothetical protein [Pseudoxanthomonas sp.]WDS37355.1 MAG: hypothetical protein O8I58_05590 [Pseudoxanthomonas sp.]
MNMELPAVVRRMEAQERLAYLGLAIFFWVTGYLFWQVFFSEHRFESSHAAHVNKVAARFFLFFTAAAIWLKHRFRGVYVDERDRAITHKGLEAGFALLGILVVLASTVAGLKTYQDFFRLVPPIWLANCLLLCLGASLVVMSAVRVHAYWRDRR